MCTEAVVVRADDNRPHGTANALYYSLFPPESPATPSDGPLARFYSLMSYLLRETPARPLSLAANKLSSSSAEIITSVVTSAALHASILLDSEVLRATMGMERFKVAAMQNAGTWWKGALRLKGDVQQYDPTVAGFLPIHSAVPGAAGVGHDLVEGEVNIDGPFSYFVSTLVDRFEPTFIVAPLRSTARPSTIDVILIRPLRDAAIRELKEQGIGEKELGEEFIKSVWKVTGGMYDGGKHIDARYEDGSVIVEYFRCSSFEWTPVRMAVPRPGLTSCSDGKRRSQEQFGLSRWRTGGSREGRVPLNACDWRIAGKRQRGVHLALRDCSVVNARMDNCSDTSDRDWTTQALLGENFVELGVELFSDRAHGTVQPPITCKRVSAHYKRKEHIPSFTLAGRRISSFAVDPSTSSAPPPPAGALRPSSESLSSSRSSDERCSSASSADLIASSATEKSWSCVRSARVREREATYPEPDLGLADTVVAYEGGERAVLVKVDHVRVQLVVGARQEEQRRYCVLGEDKTGSRRVGKLGDGGVLVGVARERDKGRTRVDRDRSLRELGRKRRLVGGRVGRDLAARDGERRVLTKVLRVLLRVLLGVDGEDGHNRVVVTLQRRDHARGQRRQDHLGRRVAHDRLERLGRLCATLLATEEVCKHDEELLARLLHVLVDVLRNLVQLARAEERDEGKVGRLVRVQRLRETE